MDVYSQICSASEDVANFDFLAFGDLCVNMQAVTVTVGEHYTNIDWCRRQHRKSMPFSCAMLPSGPEVM